MTSWWNDKQRTFKPGMVREKAALYADNRCKFNRDDPRWEAYYRGYLSGYLTSQRNKFAALRVALRVSK